MVPLGESHIFLSLNSSTLSYIVTRFQHFVTRFQANNTRSGHSCLVRGDGGALDGHVVLQGGVGAVDGDLIERDLWSVVWKCTLSTDYSYV